MASTPPQPGGQADVMVVVSHLVEQMYDVIEALNSDIDRLVAERDRVKAAVSALSPGAPAAPVDPKPAPSVRVMTAKPPARKGFPASLSDEHYREVARVYNEAVAAGRPTTKAIAAHFDVPESTARNWPTVCRQRGLIDKRERQGVGGRPSKDTITPGEIRNHIEPVAAERKMTFDDNRIESIDGTRNGTLGFASRPTHVEHPPVETERHGWRPGMAAELEGADV